MTRQELNSYDHILVAFSGGKDSVACVLELLRKGVAREKVELWHHLVDGADDILMDWECTGDYCQKFADTFHLPIYFSWLDGGFRREMLRYNEAKAATVFETPAGTFRAGGTSSKVGTRCQFPQITAKLSQRWCSAYLKIDVMRIAINNDRRFRGKRVLIVSGERAEESVARACYQVQQEEKRTEDLSIDRYRPIHGWAEARVWGIIRLFSVRVHPCYYLGFSRCSCRFCIFGNKDQFATATFVAPEQAQELVHYENGFFKTMKRNKALYDLIAEGTVYQAAKQHPELVKLARSKTYTLSIIMTDWVRPAGAFAEGGGPT